MSIIFYPYVVFHFISTYSVHACGDKTYPKRDMKPFIAQRHVHESQTNDCSNATIEIDARFAYSKFNKTLSEK